MPIRMSPAEEDKRIERERGWGWYAARPVSVVDLSLSSPFDFPSRSFFFFSRKEFDRSCLSCQPCGAAFSFCFMDQLNNQNTTDTKHGNAAMDIHPAQFRWFPDQKRTRSEKGSFDCNAEMFQHWNVLTEMLFKHREFSLMHQMSVWVWKGPVCMNVVSFPTRQILMRWDWRSSCSTSVSVRLENQLCFKVDPKTSLSCKITKTRTALEFNHKPENESQHCSKVGNWD